MSNKKGEAPMKVAEGIVKFLEEIGVKKCFMVCGGMAAHLNEAISRSTKISVSYVLHEQAAVFAAEGYIKASGFKEIATACVTSGPGVTNTVTALTAAYGDSVPIIVLAGQVKTGDINTKGLRSYGVQEVPSIDIVRPVCKKSYTIGRDFLHQMEEAYLTAVSGRKGPVFIEVPLDIQSMEAGDETMYNVSCIRQVTEKLFSWEQLDELIAKSDRGVVFIGNGCKIARVERQVIEYCHKRGIPYACTWASFDCAEYNDPLFIGCPGIMAPPGANQIIQSCDLLVCLGTRLDLATTAYSVSGFGRQANRYIIDIDSTELSKFDGLERYTCIEADLEGLRTLNCSLNEEGHEPCRSSKQWLEEVAYLKRRDHELEAELVSRSCFDKKLSSIGIASVISELNFEKCVVPASSGRAEEILTRFFKSSESSTFFNSACLGSMGAGLANAIGADQYLMGSSVVICCEGDGGLMMNLQELWTARQYANRLIILVLNNNGYESIRMSQTGAFGKSFGCNDTNGLPGYDLKKIAMAANIPYLCIDNLERLKAEIKLFHANNDNILFLDCQVEDSETGPRLKNFKDKHGRIKSEPLECLSWS